MNWELYRWYHWKIKFDTALGKWYMWIDGIDMKPAGYNFLEWKGPYLVNGNPKAFDEFNLLLRGSTISFDAYGESWDLNYEIGDNLNEGLLLSYENSTTLDWVGYSLDGQVNRTILGNITMPMPNNGPHSIQVFGKTKFGNFVSNIVHFTINQPLDGVGGGASDDDDEEIEFLGLTLIIVGTSSAIGVANVAIYLIRKRRLTTISIS